MKKQRILVADDDYMILKFMNEILEPYFDIKLVTSGDALFSEVFEFNPELILLDVMMPGMDGFEVCRKLRADERTQKTKILLVTAVASHDEKIKGYDAGADDYITKPFDHEELIAKINIFLRQ